tara:strand:+ start:2161 stop:2511 length:351 start_codon:yes stop_codon:yes gene_type:complete
MSIEILRRDIISKKDTDRYGYEKGVKKVLIERGNENKIANKFNNNTKRVLKHKENVKKHVYRDLLNIKKDEDYLQLGTKFINDTQQLYRYEQNRMMLLISCNILAFGGMLKMLYSS